MLPDFIPPKLIWREEAVKKIAAVKEALRTELEKERDVFKFLPSWAFYAALLGETKTINRLNGSGLEIPLPWDERVNLPSLPTLGADAAKCADFINVKNLRSLLASFEKWTLIWEENIECGCGATEKLRKVAYGVWANHGLIPDGSSLLVKQFVRVRSEDKNYLKKHYSKYKPSKVLEKSNLVWTSVNKITVSGSGVKTEDLGITAAKRVYDPENFDKFVFWKKFLMIIKSAEEVFDD